MGASIHALLELKHVEKLSFAEHARLLEALEAEHPDWVRASLDVCGHRSEHFDEAAEPQVLERALLAAGSAMDGDLRAEACASLALLRPIERRGPERVAVLRNALEDEAAGVRQEACAALGDLGAKTPDVLDGLRGALDDRNAGVCFEAAFALAILGDGAGRMHLEQALSNRRLRLDAMRGLGRLRDPASIPALERYAGRRLGAWVDRVAALEALTRIGAPEAETRLVARIDARRREERQFALGIAEQLRLRSAIPAALRLSKSKGPDRDAALGLLERVGGPDEAETLEACGDPEALASARRIRAQSPKSPS